MEEVPINFPETLQPPQDYKLFYTEDSQIGLLGDAV